MRKPARGVRPAADDLRRRRLQHRAQHGAGGQGGTRPHHRREATAAGYHNYQQWLAGTQLEQRVSLEDYSVSNRGLRSGLVGTPSQVHDRVAEFEKVGVNLLLLQCSPQYEEMERFADQVIKPLTA